MNSKTIEIPIALPMRNVAFFFLLLFVFSSFADLRFSAGGGGLLSLSIFEICGYIMLFALITSACMRDFPYSADVSLPHGIYRWLLLYVIWGIIAALLVRGEVGKSMLGDLKTLLPGIIAYFSIILMTTSFNKANIVITAWISAGMVNVLLALSQSFFGGPHPVELGANSLEKLDIGGEIASSIVTGFFSHPNSFSQIIIPYCVVFSTAWLLSDRLYSFKSLMLLMLGAVFGVVLILTSAKGAMLWSFIAIIMAVALSRRKKLRSPLFFIGSCIICVAAINSLALLLVFNVIEYVSLGTLFSRIQFIIASMDIFIDHPLNALFGGGMRFWEEYSSLWATWDYPNAHNVYLNQTLLYGFIGLGLLLSFIFVHIKLGLRSPTGTTDPLMSPLPYLAAVFALTGSYFFEPSFSDPTQKFQLFFLLAMVIALSRIGTSSNAAGTCT